MSMKGRQLSSTVGGLLAEQRDNLRLTQAQVADSLRIQRTSISNIESGKQVLLLDVFFDFCNVLGVSPAVLLEEATKRMNEESAPHQEIEEIVSAIKEGDNE